MNKHHSTMLFVSLVAFAFLMAGTASAQEYILLGWNDLGMHCANQDFSKMAVLPPYNTLHAQLIYKPAGGGAPQILTAGYKVEYSIPGNTYSVGKTNFWTYAQQIFGLPQPLPPNIGLTGKGLTGVFDTSGNTFQLVGVPNTPFQDTDLVHEQPFQLIHLVAKHEGSETILATTDCVIPVSNEIGCVQAGCHSSETAILNEHENVTGFNRNAPILCASCHASNALGTTGNPEARPLSEVIHGHHASVVPQPDSISTCYLCHPGPRTQCLRDIMGKNPTNPLRCQYCHGRLEVVSSSVRNGRRPWLDEPDCGNTMCHGASHAAQPGKLYRMSEDHGGLYCSACHGSPHAIEPTVQPNDNLQNFRLQGKAGTLSLCSVCHSTPPTGPGPHGIMNIVQLPSAPRLNLPPNRAQGVPSNPTLAWVDTSFVQTYMLEVASDSFFTSVVFTDSLLGQTSMQVNSLQANIAYYWHVRAKNSLGYGPWSDVWSFTPASGTTYEYTLFGGWRMLSMPLEIQNACKAVLFPQARSNAFNYIPQQGYQVTDTLQCGVGYWLKLPVVTTISLTGTPFLRDTVDVVPGWNLIGTVANTVLTSNIITQPDSILGSQFFGYEAGYKTSDTLKPANAYWIRAAKSGKIILSSQ